MPSYKLNDTVFATFDGLAPQPKYELSFDIFIGTEGDDRYGYSYGTAPKPVSAFGNGGDDRLYGSRYADLLDGGDDNDVLFGLGGNDRIRGGAGDDLLEGGSGNDIMTGGSTTTPSCSVPCTGRWRPVMTSSPTSSPARTNFSSLPIAAALRRSRWRT